jgi:uncharacterized membrane protein
LQQGKQGKFHKNPQGTRTVKRTADQIRTLTLTAMGIAAVFLATRIIQVPIPLGYAHLGNAVIFLFAVYAGPFAGGAAAGLGSALADLTSFPAWTFPTLIIKTLMGMLVAWIAQQSQREGNTQKTYNKVEQSSQSIAVQDNQGIAAPGSKSTMLQADQSSTLEANQQFVEQKSVKKAGRSILRRPRTFIAVFLGASEMVLGYFAAGVLLYGGVTASAAQIPGLVLEAVIGIALFYALSEALEKAGLTRLMRRV